MSELEVVKPHSLSKFTPEVQDSILNHMLNGLPMSAAAPLSGVSLRTLHNWLAQGEEDDDSMYADFALKVRAAQGAHKAELLAMVKKAAEAGPQYWAAAMTILERLYPEEFKRPSEKSNVTVNVGILEKRVHELDSAAEVIYDGG